MELKAQGTSELFCNDVNIPQRTCSASPKGLHYLTTFLAEERLIISAGSRQLVRTAFKITLD